MRRHPKKLLGCTFKAAALLLGTINPARWRTSRKLLILAIILPLLRRRLQLRYNKRQRPTSEIQKPTTLFTTLRYGVPIHLLRVLTILFCIYTLCPIGLKEDARHKHGGKIGELTRLAVKLFPDGPPKRYEGWNIPNGVCRDDYVSFLRSLFGRSIPSPISSRW